MNGEDTLFSVGIVQDTVKDDVLAIAKVLALRHAQENVMVLVNNIVLLVPMNVHIHVRRVLEDALQHVQEPAQVVLDHVPAVQELVLQQAQQNICRIKRSLYE